jgi:hypothetical protein
VIEDHRLQKVIWQKGNPMRKIILNILGILLILGGGVWILQGINVLPGSFMSAQTKWAIYGGIVAVVGIILLILANRRKASKPK